MAKRAPRGSACELLCKQDWKILLLGRHIYVFMRRLTKQFLWSEGCCEPARRTLAPLSIPQYADEHATKNVTYDEGTSFVALLRDCAKDKDLRRGTRLHFDILKRGLLERCSNALVAMYAKCGALAQAKSLLHMHKSRDVFSWTALIVGYAQKGQGHDALDCFERMRHEGLSPDAVTFSCILQACGSIRAADKGEQIHDEVSRRGLLGDDIVLGNALIDMYAKCGMVAKAHQVLQELPIRDVVSWNALIAGYAQQGQGEQALNCFERMLREGLSPNAVTFVCILKACASIGAVDRGEQIHREIDRQGLLENNIVLGNALLDMYVKCGALIKAQQVIDNLPLRNVVSWSTLITGYAQQGQVEKAFNSFECMQREGLSPDAVTFACILKACGSIGSADNGEHIHDEIARQGLLCNNIMLGNAVVDMYAKCGALAKARCVLEELCVRDIVSWNSLIGGYAQKGQIEQALQCFEQMQCDGLSPDRVSFLHILKACGNIGAAKRGEQIHNEIARKGFLGSSVVLGTALLDMYARCGAPVKAQQVSEELPVQDVIVWSVLLGASQKYGDVRFGRWAFEHAIQVDESDGAAYVLMANLYAACGMQDGGQSHENRK